MDAQTRGLLIELGCSSKGKALNSGSGHWSEPHLVSIDIIDIGGIIGAI